MVLDGSWSCEFKNGALIDSYAGIDKNKRWKVIATNCRLPMKDGPRYLTECKNDTIITPLDSSSRIVFICSSFISVVEPKYCSHSERKI